jgi:hypothetical protein
MPKTLTPSDLDSILELHKDLKNTVKRSFDSLAVEMKEQTKIQTGSAKDIEHIKKSQEKHEVEVRTLREAQLCCPAATSHVSTIQRIGKLEKFRDRALESGALKDQSTPTFPIQALQTPADDAVAIPKVFEKFTKVSITLLLGAAVGGALLAAMLLLN